MILFNKLLPELVLPLGVSLMLLAYGAARRRRWPGIVALLLLLVASSPMVATGLMRIAEGHAIRTPAASAPSAEAIVVLSAGRLIAPGPDAIGEWGDANRFFAGLDLWRAGKAGAIVFTRPPVPGQRPGDAEGDVLAALAKELGVPSDRIHLTGDVLNTADEAREVARLLGVSDARRPTVLLVTSAFHMPRASQQFRAAGFDVVPFPAGFWLSARPFSPTDLVPSVSALRATHTALRELYGRAFYWLIS